MRINEIYNPSKKKDFIYKNRYQIQNISQIIDPNGKYIRSDDTQLFDIYLNNLFLQYYYSEHRDELIKVSDDGQNITFPKTNSNTGINS